MVERERLHLASPVPPPPFRESVELGNVLKGLVQRLGIDREDETLRLAQEWSSMVGEDVAAHTRPGRLDKGTLVVFVDNSVWLSELTRHGKHRMLQNVQQRLGNRSVRDLVLRLDPDVRG
jgi:predicted nucleic acid-binding Zn ribbon protein